MRIGYDASPLRKTRSGVGHYAASLLEALCARFPEDEFLSLSHLTQTGIQVPNLVRTQERSFPVKEVWMQLLLPRILRIHRPDLCHFTNTVAPLRTEFPYVATVHDLSLIRHPEWHPQSRRLWMRRILSASIRRARAVICDSEATRLDLLSWLPLAESRLQVVPLGVRRMFREKCGEDVRRRVLQKYRLPPSFILYVGNIEPRKNLSLLIEAFAKTGRRDMHLVLAGSRAWLWRGVLHKKGESGVADRIHLPGYVEEADLPALYQSAQVFAYPSKMEGFGLPVLEAMASGTAVIASRIEPLATLMGGTGWLADPVDPEEWTEALMLAARDTAERKERCRAAIERSSQFTWERTAAETMECYRRACA